MIPSLRKRHWIPSVFQTLTMVHTGESPLEWNRKF
jgi:hypothetical protein